MERDRRLTLYYKSTMKSVITSLVWLIACMTAVHTNAQSGLRPRGDVNCDWEVNIADVNTLVDSIFSGAKYHSFYTYDTDVNGDKEINIADLNMVIDAVLGKQLPPMPTYSGTLPVLFINTEGFRDIVSKESYLHAKWWLDNMGIEGYESIGSPDEPLGMQIKGRGNYTWSLNKKPFRIKLDEKQPLLGMDSNRHFCLLAHADDNFGKAMNAVGFELSRRIGMAYTPEHRPVEVVLNGQYIGLYFLTEKIREGKDRVNIDEQRDGETDSLAITGGWLLEIDNNMDVNTIIIDEREGGHPWYNRMWVTCHYPEVLSSQQLEYLTQFLEQANAAIYTGNKVSTAWEKYIDIDSLACFYIIGEMMDDIECFSGSCYMYKHRGDSTKLIFGPVWDFGNSFHRKNYYPDLTSFNYFIYQQPCYFHSHWIEEIAKYPHFQLVVRKHWRKFYDSGFNGLDIDTFIDNHVSNIRQAWNSDGKRWKTNNIDSRAAYFKYYLHGKIDWLQSQWGKPDDVDPDPKPIDR